jgi:hypothetical protein
MLIKIHTERFISDEDFWDYIEEQSMSELVDFG